MSLAQFLNEFIGQTAAAATSFIKRLLLLVFLLFWFFTLLGSPQRILHARRLHKIIMQRFIVFASLAAFDKDEYANHGGQHSVVHIHLVRAHQNSARDI